MTSRISSQPAPRQPTVYPHCDKSHAKPKLYRDMVAAISGADAYSVHGEKQFDVVMLHDAAGESCHHVLYRGVNVDLQLWITTGEEPLLRKLVATFRKFEGAPQQTIVFSDWNLDARTRRRSFEADIPDNAANRQDGRTERAKTRADAYNDDWDEYHHHLAAPL